MAKINTITINILMTFRKLLIDWSWTTNSLLNHDFLRSCVAADFLLLSDWFLFNIRITSQFPQHSQHFCTSALLSVDIFFFNDTLQCSNPDFFLVLYLTLMLQYLGFIRLSEWYCFFKWVHLTWKILRVSSRKIWAKKEQGVKNCWRHFVGI